MTRLHLAHGSVFFIKSTNFDVIFIRNLLNFAFTERFHSLDAKAKANPLTLEEMILMTIYS